MGDLDNSIVTLNELLRASSLSRLKILSRRNDIQLAEISEPPMVFGHWMSFILISGKALRIIFKAHFMTAAAQFFSANAYHAEAKDVSSSQALDFFREFCNLTAGQIKIELSRSNVKIGASLPGITRGFDEVYYTQISDEPKNYWRLTCGTEKIDCSVDIEILEQFKLKNLSTDDDAVQGDVEYL